MLSFGDYLIGGLPTPLKNHGVRQLGVLFPTEWKVIKFHGSKPPTRLYPNIFRHFPIITQYI
jgi:hypothetical protein